MALTTLQRLKIARAYGEEDGALIDHAEGVWNAAVDAIEAWFDKVAVQQSIKADIDAATSPVKPSVNPFDGNASQ